MIGGGSGELLGHMVSINNMVGMKLDFHPATNLVSAKRIIIQHSDVKLRSNLCNLNPHTLDVSLIDVLQGLFVVGQAVGPQLLVVLA